MLFCFSVGAAHLSADMLKRLFSLLGKKCMGLVDMDRASAAREQGYSVTLYTMQPPECSPKNNLLVGISPTLVTARLPAVPAV